MTKYEKELMDLINDTFQDEIKLCAVTIEVNTPEYAEQQGYSYKGWQVGIIKKRERSRDVRIVINSPDQDIMNEADDYKKILKSLVELAKKILNNPPSDQYISQGVIGTTPNGIEFIPKDKLRKNEL